MEFYVYIDASFLVMGAMQSQNVIGKNDQPVMYASRLLNKVKKNYNIRKREALAMVFTLHKFRYYLLGSKFVFYVNHMALVYLVNKPQVSRRLARWLLLFLEYDFTVMYKPSRTHVITDALSRLLNSTKPTNVSNQTTNASLFYTKLEWLKDVKEFLKIGQIEGMLLVQQKLVGKAKPFTLKNGGLYKMGQNNRL